MRYRLHTLLILIVPVAVGLAWWRDRSQLSSRLDLRERQIRVLQRDLDYQRQLGVPIPSNFRFKTADEMIEFLKSCNGDDDLSKGGWGAFDSSSIADETIGPLITALADLPNDRTRQFCVWLLGEIGRKKRALKVDPIPALITLLDDPSADVRGQAMDSLAKYGSLAQAALPRLKEVMHWDQGRDALFATLAVKEVDPSEEIGPRLRDLFFSEEPGVRGNVALYIPEYLPPAEARSFLMAQYQRATDKETRDAIAEAMNKIKE